MGQIYRKPGRAVWMMKYYQRGVCIRQTTGETDEKRARKVLHAVETDRDRGLPVGRLIGTMRVEEAARDLLADYAINGRKSTRMAEARLRCHLLPAFRGVKLADLRTADFRAYTKARLDEGAAAGSINLELSLLKRMYGLAVQGERLAYRPHIPMLTLHNVRTGFFEPEAFATVRRHLPAAVRPVVTVAYLTGWRVTSELLPIEWRQVDLEANELRLDPQATKNGQGRVFPLTSELRAVFLAQADARAGMLAQGQLCPWVFFREHRGVPRPIKYFVKAWRAACRAAGCPGRIPHDFRRTAVRNMVRRGVPERVAMQLTGHLTRTVFERYNIVSAGDLTQAAARLEGQLPAATGTPTGTPRRTSVSLSRESPKTLSKTAPSRGK